MFDGLPAYRDTRAIADVLLRIIADGSFYGDAFCGTEGNADRDSGFAVIAANTRTDGNSLTIQYLRNVCLRHCGGGAGRSFMFIFVNGVLQAAEITVQFAQLRGIGVHALLSADDLLAIARDRIRCVSCQRLNFLAP